MNNTKRLIASLLIASTTLMGLPLTANAGIVSTDTTLTADATVANRDQVTTFLARADVQKAMQERGVNGADAIQRVQSMSDAEVAQLAGRIDQAPAGGEVIGVLFTVFIILAGDRHPGSDQSLPVHPIGAMKRLRAFAASPAIAGVFICAALLLGGCASPQVSRSV